MRKIDDVRELLFPVDIRPLMFVDRAGGTRNIESRRVIVNRKSQVPLGVVGAGYRLVTNEQALEFGRDCAAQVFGAVSADMEVFNVIAPRTRSCCHIDLVHRAHEVHLLKREVYLPFVRVTNSYNTTRALRFDVGYCRKICLNGVIFGNRSIRFVFSHSRDGVPDQLDFHTGAKLLEDLRQSFAGTAERLMGFPVRRSDAVALLFRALALPLPVEPREAPPNDTFLALRDAARGLVASYEKQLGKNAYAAFNAMTDFASHPPDVPQFRRSPHTLQAAAGGWAEAFGRLLAANKDFDLRAFLGPCQDVDRWN